MICDKCGTVNDEGYKFCMKCGMPLGEEKMQTPGLSAAPNTVYAVHPHKDPFSWGDISVILGFVCSIAGMFWFWLLLCPVGLGFSIFGFYKNKTKKLAVAGIVISALGILIKIGYILYTNNWLPSWVTSGVLG